MKMKKVTCFVAVFFFLAAAMPQALFSAEEIASLNIKNYRTYSVTEKEFESLKKQPGITFYSESPNLPAGKYLVISVPSQLGGGYLAGTPDDTASAFNSAGITVGLKPSSLTGNKSAIAGKAASAILGVIMAVATGTSKPIVSQVYDSGADVQDGKKASSKKTPVPEKDLFPTDVHYPADHHAAEHHVPLVVPNQNQADAKTTAPRKTPVPEKDLFPTDVHYPADHHAAEHHVDMFLELKGTGLEKTNEGKTAVSKSLFNPVKDFHPTDIHYPADHHAAEHH